MVIDLCLMSREQKVFYFTVNITDKYCEITDIGSIISTINCPELILNAKDKKNALKFWWQMRCMPVTRRDFTNIITMLYKNPLIKKHQQDDAIFLISLMSYAQNIKDHYWINPAHEFKIKFPNMSPKFPEIVLKPVTFDEIDFYQNPVVEDDIIKLVLDCYKKDYDFDNYFSPNICVQGDKIKFWEYNKNENKYYLHKYLHGLQEVEENEFKVYEFVKSENPNLAMEPIIVRKNLLDYGVSEKDISKKYVSYPNFITVDTELVTGEEILLAQGPQSGDLIDIFYDNCSYLSIPIKFVDEIISISTALDKYFDMEEDIDFDNIGFIRDIHTKQFIGPAPMFGNSYFREIL